MLKTIMIGLVAATGLSGGTAGAATVADDFSSFFVLGDSLSDNGNLYRLTGGTVPATPPYFDGRFSNGPVWNESLIAAVVRNGKPAGNFAFGGARAVANPEPDALADDADPATDRVPDLDLQSAALMRLGGTALAGGAADLVSLWFGANDVFGAVGQDRATDRVEQAADAVLDEAERLGALGAETVLVFNLPDLGATPRYSLFDPARRQEASELTEDFNARLAAGTRNLGNPNVRLIEIDRLFEDFLGSTALETRFPCVWPTAAAAAQAGRPAVCSDPEDYAFFDAVHPTASVHDRIASEVRRELSPVPLPAGAPLLLVALAALGFARRRR